MESNQERTEENGNVSENRNNLFNFDVMDSMMLTVHSGAEGALTGLLQSDYGSFNAVPNHILEPALPSDLHIPSQALSEPALDFTASAPWSAFSASTFEYPCPISIADPEAGNWWNAQPSTSNGEGTLEPGVLSSTFTSTAETNTSTATTSDNNDDAALDMVIKEMEEMEENAVFQRSFRARRLAEGGDKKPTHTSRLKNPSTMTFQSIQRHSSSFDTPRKSPHLNKGKRWRSISSGITGELKKTHSV
jgi:hypothetical protein